MKEVFFPFVCATLLICSCSPKVVGRITGANYSKQPVEDVVILGKEEKLPNFAVLVGRICVKPVLFTTTKKGTYDKLLFLASEKAKKSGGNAIKIVEHVSPSRFNPCHKIIVDIYYNPEIEVKLPPVTISSHPEYASVWLYRNSWNPECVYDVFIGEEWVFWSSSNTMTEVRMYQPRTYEIWAKTERKKSLYITVELGKDYYIETNLCDGFFEPNPWLFQVSEFAGKEACGSMEFMERK